MQVIPGVGGHPPHWFNIWGSLCESLESHALRLKLRRNRVVKHDINGQGQKIDRLPIFI